MFESNRVVGHTGTRWPIFQAPMGWIARSPLVCAVAEAGGLGILETSSGDFAAVRAEMSALHRLTDRPWAVNLPLSFLRRDDSILADVLASGVRIVTTSAGDPAVYAQRLHQAGITVYHAVPSVEAAMKAEQAGVDGLVVEGNESAAFRNPREIHTFALIQAVRRRTRLPIVAAGGIVDGVGMAAAFALGAEGVQMGTRFLCSAESPVHPRYKHAVIDAGPASTVVTNRGRGPCVRTLRTQLTEALETGAAGFTEALRNTQRMYFDGDLDSGLPSAGESAGFIDGVEDCASIISRMIDQFAETIDRLRRA